MTPDLPLRSTTDPSWAEHALREPLALLADHAHLEKKAAANALALLDRWPRDAERDPVDGIRWSADAWVRALAGVARDEVEHLGLVLRTLTRRGGRMPRGHRNPYAAGLHALVRRGAGTDELVDRLLVSAAIEARSCERFHVLAAVTADPELRALYRALEIAEKGHHRAFLELAGRVAEPAAVERRWAWLLDREAPLLRAQAPGARMHAGEPGGAGGA